MREEAKQMAWDSGYKEELSSCCVDEHIQYQVRTTRLKSDPEHDGEYVEVIAYRTGANDLSSALRFRVCITRSLRQESPFTKYPDLSPELETTLQLLALHVLKTRLRENSTSPDLSPVTLNTANVDDYLRFHEGKLEIVGEDHAGFDDRQIAKRRILKRLSKHPFHMGTEGLRVDQRLNSGTLQSALRQLLHDGYILGDQQAWNLSPKSEAVVMKNCLQVEFPLRQATSSQKPSGSKRKITGTGNIVLGSAKLSDSVRTERSREDHEFDVALSFAGEDRATAREISALLKQKGARVFYDEDEQAQLWGKDLYQHLQTVYRDKSRYCIVFLSEAYSRKLWPKHELRQAQARALVEDEYILPVRLDDTEIPGVNPTVGYIDMRTTPIEKLVSILLQKLGTSDHPL